MTHYAAAVELYQRVGDTGVAQLVSEKTARSPLRDAGGVLVPAPTS
jgi:hypothetical protein